MMAAQKHKPLMRCLGEFVGHIMQAVKPNSKTREIGRKIEERSDGNITLRRTTIDEIEIKTEDTNSD